MLWMLLNLAYWLFTASVVYYASIFSLLLLWRVYKLRISKLWSMQPVRAEHAIMITGATSGIGLALSKHFYKIGYSVVATYFDSSEPGYCELEQLQKRSVELGQKMLLVELDVKSEASIKQAYDKIEAKLEEHNLSLYALINNAGLGSLMPFAMIRKSIIRSLMETNLLGAMLTARQFTPMLVTTAKRCRKMGCKSRIINISSALAFMPGRDYMIYGVSKIALVYMSQCINLELEQAHGVISVAIAPTNFIRLTNISRANMDHTWEELSPLEQSLYKSQYDDHLIQCNRFDRFRDKHKLYVAKELEKRRQSDVNQSSLSIGQSIRRLVRSFVQNLKFDSSPLTLEESGLLECLEESVRLNDPPEVMFAGNEMYSLVMGPFMLTLPNFIAVWLFNSRVVRNLYR